jgi:hypothetical protein
MFDLAEDARRLVGECEITGNRTLFTRGDRVVATMISWDEYNALRETLAVMGDAELRARIESGEEQARRGAILELADLSGGES